jgi:hypothetical protein
MEVDFTEFFKLAEQLPEVELIDLCDGFQCVSPGVEEHTCPYKEEIHGDDSLCNCCSSCMHNCAMEV